MPWATFVWFDLEDFTVVVTQLGTSFNQSIIFVCVIITSVRLTFMSYFEFFSVTVTRLEGFFRVSYKDVAYQTPNSWEISRFYHRHATRTDATTGFPAKCRLRNESKNSILMTSGYCFWLVGNTTQIWLVTRHQYGTSAFVTQTSFRWETSGSVQAWVAPRNIGCFLRQFVYKQEIYLGLFWLFLATKLKIKNLLVLSSLSTGSFLTLRISYLLRNSWRRKICQKNHSRPRSEFFQREPKQWKQQFNQSPLTFLSSGIYQNSKSVSNHQICMLVSLFSLMFFRNFFWWPPAKKTLYFYF